MINAVKGIKSCFVFIKRHKAYYFTMLLAGIVLMYGADVLFAMLNREVVNSVTAFEFSGLKTAVWLGLAAMAAYLLEILVRFLKMRSVRFMMYDLRRDLFRHMELLPVEYFEKNHSADSIFRLNSNVENMKRAYASFFVSVTQGLLGAVLLSAFVLVMDVRLGVISLFSCFLTVFVNVRFAEPLRRIGRRIQNSESRLLSCLSDLLAGFRVIKLYDSDGAVVSKYEAANDETARLRVKRIAGVGAVDSMGNLLNFINGFVLITIGALMAAAGYTDFGTVFAILSVQGNVSSALLGFGGAWGMLQECVAAAGMINDIFEIKPERRAPLESLEHSGSGAYIEFKNVSFSYNVVSKALDGLSLRVDKGEVAALVGPSGGGKSTVIKLLPGFYDTDGGGVYIAGKNIRAYSISELRDMISYVPQDAYLFDASVRENISYGKPGAAESEIIEAAKAANADGFISQLPQGYDTVVGERGESLSGGQRQRIAIARAFLKNAPILLLDEATSALDTENELIVQSSIEALMKNRTVIVVAHRLSTIENADIIYVIENGAVVQSGTHSELKEAAGTYAELVKLAK
ncbi:MAG TPA: ABC transporter ATP-binding protein/permease [Candidatus Monoglobus merdigallinarum]|uniref:ABC transporter ATP-binding protein/permease n=1 Tax=Candidatus Monoglobus merdigallinarum TaxID=2838698 RepID=A0A9D1TN60_9FIRM|nr:ABC transporter ATP-binding protein/permease [Candidatus Monoglobus merdigallinarum]